MHCSKLFNQTHCREVKRYAFNTPRGAQSLDRIEELARWIASVNYSPPTVRSSRLRFRRKSSPPKEFGCDSKVACRGRLLCDSFMTTVRFVDGPDCIRLSIGNSSWSLIQLKWN
jgi:hypothetical protein